MTRPLADTADRQFRFSYLLGILGLIAGMYLWQIGAGNGNYLLVELQAQDDQAFTPQLYYRDKSGDYAESNAAYGETLTFAETSVLRFGLPRHLGDLGYLRLDPDRKPSSIYLGRLLVVEKQWFRYRLSWLPNSIFRPVNQVGMETMVDGRLLLTGTGNDPALEARYAPLESASWSNFHLRELALSLLIGLAVAFLGSYFRRHPASDESSFRLILYVLFIGLAVFKITYYKENVAYGDPPDEVRHVEYLDYLRASGRLIPEFDNMYAPGQSGQVNTAHPPLYYHLLIQLTPPGNQFEQQAVGYRDAGALLAVIGFCLLAYIGFREQLSPLAHFTYLSLVSSVPMLAYLGASVNNDTLAVLGGTLFGIGLIDFLARTDSMRAWILLLLGASLAYFSKLTAALLVLIAMFIVFVYLLRRRMLPTLSIGKLVVLAVFAVPVLSYQGYLLLEYGSVLPPDLMSKDPEAFSVSDFSAGIVEQRLSLTQWFWHHLGYIREGWFGIHSHHSFAKETFWGFAALLMLHVFAVAGLLLGPRGRPALYLAAAASMVATLVLLLFQFFYTYSGHLAGGYLGGLQPRYLLPLIFSLGVMAALFVDRFGNRPILVVAIALVNLGALYSDLFYFLRYYPE